MGRGKSGRALQALNPKAVARIRMRGVRGGRLLLLVWLLEMIILMQSRLSVIIITHTTRIRSVIGCTMLRLMRLRRVSRRSGAIIGRMDWWNPTLHSGTVRVEVATSGRWIGSMAGIIHTSAASSASVTRSSHGRCTMGWSSAHGSAHQIS